MSTKARAVRRPAAKQLPIPLDPAAAEGPMWLRTVETAPPAEGVAQPAAEVEVEVVPPPTAHDFTEIALDTIDQIDATITGLQAMRTQMLAVLGHVAVDTARAERLDTGIAVRDLANELALRQRRSDRTVEAEVSHAMRTLDDWPATLTAWGETRIHRGHLSVITEIGAPLKTPEARAAFEQALLPVAETTTPARLRTIARRELERLLDEPLAERHRTAREQRAVLVTDRDDGMSMVNGLVPTVLAHGILDRLTQMARAADGDDPRTVDQRRADAFCDLLLTGEPTDRSLAGIRAQITIVIPATTLVGDDRGDSPRLRSGSLVDPDTARRLAGVTKLWTRVFTDPVTGHVVAVDTYRASRKLRRLLRERDQRCRWPGCNARAEHADIDHTIPWADGGTTTIGNLAHLCRRHHMLKGAILAGGRRWKVRHLQPGVLQWTSPDGAVYVDAPDPIGPRFTDTGTDAEWLWRGMIGPLPLAPF